MSSSSLTPMQWINHQIEPIWICLPFLSSSLFKCLYFLTLIIIILPDWPICFQVWPPVMYSLSYSFSSKFRHWVKWTQRHKGEQGHGPMELTLFVGKTVNTLHCFLSTFQKCKYDWNIPLYENSSETSITYRKKYKFLSMAVKPLCNMVWGYLYSLNSHNSSTQHPVFQAPKSLWLLEQSPGISHSLLHCFVYTLHFYTSFEPV